ncbi:hypothetical protein DPEC_G00275640 [Dallia pectoralis]|uniref:Uncharacterized protein n=1 Tax=Dallia pectoralis TaxID=75939 RepID=A0ACC2FL95_DALPE|nr:hypothetical protein DPEC_G00275640 [Dallia pectoralis]
MAFHKGEPTPFLCTYRIYTSGVEVRSPVATFSGSPAHNAGIQWLRKFCEGDVTRTRRLTSATNKVCMALCTMERLLFAIKTSTILEGPWRLICWLWQTCVSMATENPNRLPGVSPVLTTGKRTSRLNARSAGTAQHRTSNRG